MLLQLDWFAVHQDFLRDEVVRDHDEFVRAGGMRRFDHARRRAGPALGRWQFDLVRAVGRMDAHALSFVNVVRQFRRCGIAVGRRAVVARFDLLPQLLCLFRHPLNVAARQDGHASQNAGSEYAAQLSTL